MEAPGGPETNKAGSAPAVQCGAGVQILVGMVGASWCEKGRMRHPVQAGPGLAISASSCATAFQQEGGVQQQDAHFRW